MEVGVSYKCVLALLYCMMERSKLVCDIIVNLIVHRIIHAVCAVMVIGYVSLSGCQCDVLARLGFM